FFGAILWTIHFMMIYGLSEFGCVAGSSWMKWAVIALTILLIGAGLFSIYKTWKISEVLDKNNSPGAFFLSRYGILNNSVFTFIMAFQSLPIFYFRGACF